jgi:hypothetical protein
MSGQSVRAHPLDRSESSDAWSGPGTQILAVERQDVEGVKLHFVFMPAAVQRVEVGNAVDAEHHGFAIDHELLESIFQCHLNDPRIAAGPVVAASGDQAHAVAVALSAEAIAVILHFRSQSGPVGTASDLVGRQNLCVVTPKSLGSGRG